MIALVGAACLGAACWLIGVLSDSRPLLLVGAVLLTTCAIVIGLVALGVGLALVVS